MVLCRLIGPARDRGKHRFGRVTGDLRHQLSKLWRVGGDIDRLVEFVVEPDRPVIVIAGVGIFQFGLDLLQLSQLLVGDTTTKPRRGCCESSPSALRTNSASRTGVTLTPSSVAN